MQGTREERRMALLKYSAARPNDPGRQMQHMLDLDDEFPEVDMFGPQSISAEVGPGWAGLLRPVLSILREHRCKVGQIKQKFGGLRVYWDFPDEIEGALQVWRENPNNSTEAPFKKEYTRLIKIISPVVSEAEKLSFKTCEICGDEARLNKGPAYRTLCSEHDR